jgi:hypothetical protein
MKTKELTAEALRNVINYDKDTGIFTWAFARRGCAKGSKAGCIGNNGYVYIRVHGALHLGHRLAWLYVTGNDASNQIDHINWDRKDNRFENLREATNTENTQNIRLNSKKNKLGFLGVYQENSKYKAEIRANGKKYRIGLFNTPEEAHQAYIAKKRELHSHNML